MGKFTVSFHRFLETSSEWSLCRKACVNCTLLVLVLILVFLAGEAGLRAYHITKYHNVEVSESSIRLDGKLGWVPNPSYSFHGDKHDASGAVYHADVRQENVDFRIYGDDGVAGGRKILFLGDSFTHSVEVDNDSTFCSKIAGDLGLEPFVLGVGGYSNLQECLLLRKHIAEIDPDLVVLQFCSNDFVNNHYDLELRSVVANNGLRRPYVTIDGDTIYAIPKKFSFVRDFVIKHSRLAYYVLSRLDMINAGRESVEDEIRERGRAVEDFAEAVTITDRLIGSIRECIPDRTPLYVFTVDEDEPFFSEMRRILRRRGIPFIEGVSRELAKAEEEGVPIRAADRMHWNEEGHRIVAREIERYLGPMLSTEDRSAGTLGDSSLLRPPGEKSL